MLRTSNKSPSPDHHGAVRHEPSEWLAGAAQLLEESHLAAWTPNAPLRERFGLEMAWYLQKVPQARTLVWSGAEVRDLAMFCQEVGTSLGGLRVEASIDGPHGLLEALRRRPSESRALGDAAIVKHCYYVWRDADALLLADRTVFGRLVDALAGVAAEAEFASEDRLLIHRVLFVGGPALRDYAGDERGQFRRWYAEGKEEPLWSTVSGLASPQVGVYEVR